MYPCFDALVRQERNMQLLKEAEQERLIQAVRENRVHSKGWQQVFSDWSGQAALWFAPRLTMWGAKLQHRPLVVAPLSEGQNCC